MRVVTINSHHELLEISKAENLMPEALWDTAILLQEDRSITCICHGSDSGIDQTLIKKIEEISHESLPDGGKLYLVSCYAGLDAKSLIELSLLTDLTCFASTQSITRSKENLTWEGGWDRRISQGRLVEINDPLSPGLQANLSTLWPFWYGSFGVTDISTSNLVKNQPIVTVFPRTQEIPSLETSLAGYGRAIAATDELVIVGGATYADIFAPTGYNWAKMQRITSSPASTSFGSAVAITSNANGTSWAAISNENGGVTLYSYNSSAIPSSSWTASQTLSFSPTGIQALAMHDHLLAISTSNNLVYLYRHTNKASSPWEQLGTALSGQASSNFGKSLSLHHLRLAVGASTWTGPLGTQGAAFVYLFDPNSSTYTLEFTASGASSNSSFGISVALWGDTLAVGAPDESSAAGRAYVFRRDSTWYPFNNSGTVSLAPASIVANGKFGSCVALRDNILAVSYPSPSANSSSVWFFQEGASNFGCFNQLSYSDFATTNLGNSSGPTIALTGRYLFAGDPLFAGNAAVANSFLGQLFSTMYKYGLNTLTGGYATGDHLYKQRGIYLDGSNQIEVPLTTQLTSWPVTVSFFFQPTASIANQTLFSASGISQGFRLTTNSTGNVVLLYKNGSSSITLTSSNTLYLNKTDHIAFSASSSLATVYVDTIPTSGTWTAGATTGALSISGPTAATFGPSLTGVVSHIAVWNHILDRSDIGFFTRYRLLGFERSRDTSGTIFARVSQLYTTDEESGIYLYDSAHRLAHATLNSGSAGGTYPQRVFLEDILSTRGFGNGGISHSDSMALCASGFTTSLATNAGFTIMAQASLMRYVSMVSGTSSPNENQGIFYSQTYSLLLSNTFTYNRRSPMLVGNLGFSWPTFFNGTRAFGANASNIYVGRLALTDTIGVQSYYNSIRSTLEGANTLTGTVTTFYIGFASGSVPSANPDQGVPLGYGALYGTFALYEENATATTSHRERLLSLRSLLPLSLSDRSLMLFGSAGAARFAFSEPNISTANQNTLTVRSGTATTIANYDRVPFPVSFLEESGTYFDAAGTQSLGTITIPNLQNFSYSFWLLRKTITSNHTGTFFLLTSGATTLSSLGYSVTSAWIQSGNTFYRGSGTSFALSNSAHSSQGGVPWSHWVITHSGISATSTLYTIYTDGVAIANGTATLGSALNATSTWTIGITSSFFDASTPPNPRIKFSFRDLAFHNMTLNLNEIQALAYRRISLKNPYLIAYYPLQRLNDTAVANTTASTLYNALNNSSSSISTVYTQFTPTLKSRWVQRSATTGNVTTQRISDPSITFSGGRVMMDGKFLAALDFKFEAASEDQCFFSIETEAGAATGPYLALSYRLGTPNNFCLIWRNSGSTISSNITANIEFKFQTENNVALGWTGSSAYGHQLFSYEPMRFVCNFISGTTGEITGISGLLCGVSWSCSLGADPFTVGTAQATIIFGGSRYAAPQSFNGSISDIRLHRSARSVYDYFNSVERLPPSHELICAFPHIMQSTSINTSIPDQVHNKYVLTNFEQAVTGYSHTTSATPTLPAYTHHWHLNAAVSDYSQVSLLQFSGWDESPRATGQLRILSLPSYGSLYQYNPASLYNRGTQITAPITITGSTALSTTDTSIYRLVFQHPQSSSAQAITSFTYDFSDGVERTLILTYLAPIVSTLSSITLAAGTSSTALSSSVLTSTNYWPQLTASSLSSWTNSTTANYRIRTPSGTDWALRSGATPVSYNALISSSNLSTLSLASTSALPYSVTIQPAWSIENRIGDSYTTNIPTYLDTASGGITHILGDSGSLVISTLTLLPGSNPLLYIAKYNASGSFTVSATASSIHDNFFITPSTLVTLDTSTTPASVCYSGNPIATYATGSTLTLGFNTPYASLDAVQAVLRRISYYYKDLTGTTPITKSITCTLLDPGEYLPGVAYAGSKITKSLTISTGISFTPGTASTTYAFSSLPLYFDQAASGTIPYVSGLTIIPSITSGDDTGYDSVDFYSGTTFTVAGTQISLAGTAVADYDSTTKVLTLLSTASSNAINQLLRSWRFSSSRSTSASYPVNNRTIQLSLSNLYGLSLSRSYTLEYFGIKASTANLTYLVGTTNFLTLDSNATAALASTNGLVITATIASSAIGDTLTIGSSGGLVYTAPSTLAWNGTTVATLTTSNSFSHPSAGSISYSFNGSSNSGSVIGTLGGISFSNNNASTTEGIRTINFQVSGSMTTSLSYTLEVLVPVTLASGSTPSTFLTSSTPIQIDPLLSLNAPVNGTYTITASFIGMNHVNDSLSFVSTGEGISYNGGTQQVLLNGTSVASCSIVAGGISLTSLPSGGASLQSILRALAFSTTGSNPLSRTLRLDITRTYTPAYSPTPITLSGILDYPLLIQTKVSLASGSSTATHINQLSSSPTIIDSTALYQVDAPETATLAATFINSTNSAGDLLLTNLSSAQLTAYNATGNLSGTSLLFTFGASSVAADVQEVVRSLAFTTALYPSNETDRQIKFLVTDRWSNSGSVTYTVPVLLQHTLVPSKTTSYFTSPLPPLAIDPSIAATLATGVTYQVATQISPYSASDTVNILSPFSTSAGTLLNGGIGIGTLAFGADNSITAALPAAHLQSFLQAISFNSTSSTASTNRIFTISVGRNSAPLLSSATASYTLDLAVPPIITSGTIVNYSVSTTSTATSFNPLTITSSRWNGSTLSVTSALGTNDLFSLSNTLGLTFAAGTVISGGIAIASYVASSNGFTATFLQDVSNTTLSSLAQSAYFQNNTLTSSEGTPTTTYTLIYPDTTSGSLTIPLNRYISLDLTSTTSSTPISYILGTSAITLDPAITSRIALPLATILSATITPNITGDYLLINTPAGMDQTIAGTITLGGTTLLTYSWNAPTLTLTPTASATSSQIQTLLQNLAFGVTGNANLSTRAIELRASRSPLTDVATTYTISPISPSTLTPSFTTALIHANTPSLTNTTDIDPSVIYTIHAPTNGLLSITLSGTTGQSGDLLLTTLTSSDLTSYHLSGALSGSSLLFTGNGSTTTNSFQSVARSIAFKTTTYPSNETPRVLLFTFTDLYNLSGRCSYTINVPVQHAFITSNSTTLFTTTQLAKAIAPTLTSSLSLSATYEIDLALNPTNLTASDQLSFLSPYSVAGTTLLNGATTVGNVTTYTAQHITFSALGAEVDTLLQKLAFATAHLSESGNRSALFTLSRNEPSLSSTTHTQTLDVALLPTLSLTTTPTTYFVSTSSAPAKAADISLSVWRSSGSTLTISTSPQTGDLFSWSNALGFNFSAGNVISGATTIGSFTGISPFTVTLNQDISNTTLTKLAQSLYLENTTPGTAEGIRIQTYTYTYPDGAFSTIAAPIDLYVLTQLVPSSSTTIDYILNTAPQILDTNLYSWTPNPSLTTLEAVISPVIAGDQLSITTPPGFAQATPGTITKGGTTVLDCSWSSATSQLSLTAYPATTNADLQALLQALSFSSTTTNTSLRTITLTSLQAPRPTSTATYTLLPYCPPQIASSSSSLTHINAPALTNVQVVDPAATYQIENATNATLAITFSGTTYQTGDLLKTNLSASSLSTYHMTTSNLSGTSLLFSATAGITSSSLQSVARSIEFTTTTYPTNEIQRTLLFTVTDYRNTTGTLSYLVNVLLQHSFASSSGTELFTTTYAPKSIAPSLTATLIASATYQVDLTLSATHSTIDDFFSLLLPYTNTGATLEYYGVAIPGASIVTQTSQNISLTLPGSYVNSLIQALSFSTTNLLETNSRLATISLSQSNPILSPINYQSTLDVALLPTGSLSVTANYIASPTSTASAISDLSINAERWSGSIFTITPTIEIGDTYQWIDNQGLIFNAGTVAYGPLTIGSYTSTAPYTITLYRDITNSVLSSLARSLHILNTNPYTPEGIRRIDYTFTYPDATTLTSSFDFALYAAMSLNPAYSSNLDYIVDDPAITIDNNLVTWISNPSVTTISCFISPSVSTDALSIATPADFIETTPGTILSGATPVLGYLWNGASSTLSFTTYPATTNAILQAILQTLTFQTIGGNALGATSTQLRTLTLSAIRSPLPSAIATYSILPYLAPVLSQSTATINYINNSSLTQTTIDPLATYSIASPGTGTLTISFSGTTAQTGDLIKTSLTAAQLSIHHFSGALSGTSLLFTSSVGVSESNFQAVARSILFTTIYPSNETSRILTFTASDSRALERTLTYTINVAVEHSLAPSSQTTLFTTQFSPQPIAPTLAASVDPSALYQLELNLSSANLAPSDSLSLKAPYSILGTDLLQGTTSIATIMSNTSQLLRVSTVGSYVSAIAQNICFSTSDTSQSNPRIATFTLSRAASSFSDILSTYTLDVALLPYFTLNGPTTYIVSATSTATSPADITLAAWRTYGSILEIQPASLQVGDTLAWSNQFGLTFAAGIIASGATTIGTYTSSAPYTATIWANISSATVNTLVRSLCLDNTDTNTIEGDRSFTFTFTYPDGTSTNLTTTLPIYVALSLSRSRATVPYFLGTNSVLLDPLLSAVISAPQATSVELTLSPSIGGELLDLAPPPGMTKSSNSILLGAVSLLSYNWDGTTLSFTPTPSLTQANYQAILQGITFSTVGIATPTSYTLSLAISRSPLTAAAISYTLNTYVAPTLNPSSPTIEYALGSTAISIDPSIITACAWTSGTTFQIELSPIYPSDILAISSSAASLAIASQTLSYMGMPIATISTTPTLISGTLNDTATSSMVQYLLRSITFENQDTNSVEATRDLNVSLTYPSTPTLGATTTYTIQTFQGISYPTLGTTSIDYTTTSAPILIAPNISSHIPSPVNTRLTVSIPSSISQEMLDFETSFSSLTISKTDCTISASGTVIAEFDQSNSSMTIDLLSNITSAQIDKILQSITYQNIFDSPSVGSISQVIYELKRKDTSVIPSAIATYTLNLFAPPQLRAPDALLDYVIGQTPSALAITSASGLVATVPYPTGTLLSIALPYSTYTGDSLYFDQTIADSNALNILISPTNISNGGGTVLATYQTQPKPQSIEISLTGAATDPFASNLFSTTVYSNSDISSPEQERSAFFTLAVGNGLTVIARYLINVLNPPRFTASLTNKYLGYTSGDPNLTIDTLLRFTIPKTNGANLFFSIDNPLAGDQLLFGSTSGLAAISNNLLFNGTVIGTYTYNLAASGILSASFSANATTNSIRAALRNIQFGTSTNIEHTRDCSLLLQHPNYSSTQPFNLLKATLSYKIAVYRQPTLTSSWSNADYIANGNPLAIDALSTLTLRPFPGNAIRIIVLNSTVDDLVSVPTSSMVASSTINLSAGTRTLTATLINYPNSADTTSFIQAITFTNNRTLSADSTRTIQLQLLADNGSILSSTYFLNVYAPPTFSSTGGIFSSVSTLPASIDSSLSLLSQEISNARLQVTLSGHDPLTDHLIYTLPSSMSDSTITDGKEILFSSSATLSQVQSLLSSMQVYAEATSTKTLLVTLQLFTSHYSTIAPYDELTSTITYTGTFYPLPSLTLNQSSTPYVIPVDSPVALDPTAAAYIAPLLPRQFTIDFPLHYNNDSLTSSVGSGSWLSNRWTLDLSLADDASTALQAILFSTSLPTPELPRVLNITPWSLNVSGTAQTYTINSYIQPLLSGDTNTNIYLAGEAPLPIDSSSTLLRMGNTLNSRLLVAISPSNGDEALALSNSGLAMVSNTITSGSTTLATYTTPSTGAWEFTLATTSVADFNLWRSSLEISAPSDTPTSRNITYTLYSADYSSTTSPENILLSTITYPFTFYPLPTVTQGTPNLLYNVDGVGSSLQLDPTITATTPTIPGMKVRFTQSPFANGDTWALTDQSSIITSAGSTHTLQPTITDTALNALLRSLTYSNINRYGADGIRTVMIELLTPRNTSISTTYNFEVNVPISLIPHHDPSGYAEYLITATAKPLDPLINIYLPLPADTHLNITIANPGNNDQLLIPPANNISLAGSNILYLGIPLATYSQTPTMIDIDLLSSATAAGIATLLPLVSFFNNDLTTSAAIRTITYTLSRGSETSTATYLLKPYFPLSITPSFNPPTIEYVSHDPTITVDNAVSTVSSPTENATIDIYLENGGANDVMGFAPLAPLASDGNGHLTYNGTTVADYTISTNQRHLHAEMGVGATNDAVEAIFSSITFYNASNTPKLHLLRDTRIVRFQLSSNIPVIPTVNCSYRINVDHNPNNRTYLQVKGITLLKIRRHDEGNSI
jgi:hypothetical protein